MEPYRLMAPGPVNLSPEVLHELSQPMLHHRTPEFEKYLREALANLKYAFQTEEPVYILTSTGSGAMEAAIVNTLSPGDEVLVIVSGKFGERWSEMANVYGCKVTEIQVPWGEAVSVEQVEAAFRKNAKFKAVLCQACETSTAVKHPVQEIAAFVRKNENCIFMIDAITAILCMELPMDAWGLDVVVAGSQKAFMLPTGLSFIALSQKAQKFMQDAKIPRYYLDLTKEKKAVEKNQTYYSTSVSLVRALNVMLKNLKAKGLKAFTDEVALRARATRAGLKALGLKEYSQSPSPSLTAVLVPEGMDAKKIRAHMEQKYNITIMAGQDQVENKILRIGHIGYITPDDVVSSIRLLGLSLQDLGYKCDIETALQKTKEVLT